MPGVRCRKGASNHSHSRVKLLLDENLSRRLAEVVRKDFPESAHVGSLGLLQANDAQIWQFATQQGFTIVSKDSDFAHLSEVWGAPPKVVWLNVGNARTSQLAHLLRSHLSDLASFETAEESPLLILSLPSDEWLSRQLRTRN